MPSIGVWWIIGIIGQHDNIVKSRHMLIDRMRFVYLAKTSGKGQMLIWCYFLIAKENHAIIDQRFIDHVFLASR